jgi:hypothetical protein
MGNMMMMRVPASIYAMLRAVHGMPGHAGALWSCPAEHASRDPNSVRPATPPWTVLMTFTDARVFRTIAACNARLAEFKRCCTQLLTLQGTSQHM